MSSNRYCPFCGSENPAINQFCSNCGADLGASQMKPSDTSAYESIPPQQPMYGHSLYMARQQSIQHHHLPRNLRIQLLLD
ncbi:MAG: zinc ribbon domain-containing protein [Candidatus Heimdallarchaeota archaeon]|nr:zinc ribbon domain-containing protein [Candidatus Heimdallarchaeota archaeon]